MKCPHCNQEHPNEFLFCPITGDKIGKTMTYTNGSQHEYDAIGSFYEGRAIVRKDDKCGVIDINGKVIVPCTYSKILRFSEGVAVCQKDSDGWAFMDLNGRIVAKVAEGLDVTSDIGFMEGRCVVYGTVEYDDDCSHKYGYIDKTGRLCIDLQFDYAVDFHEGFAWVALEDEDGYSVQFYINSAGERAFPYEYLSCNDFAGDYAIAKALHGKWFVIDKDGQIVFKFNNESKWHDANTQFISYGLHNKLLWFHPNEQSKYFFWNNVKTLWSGFSEGYAAVCSSENSKWGFITEFGKLAVPFIYDEARDYKGGLAAVKVDGLWGYIDYSGAMVIKPVYDEVEDFNESRAVVRKDGLPVVIDKLGNPCF